MKQLRDVWMSCTRDNVEADESYFLLNLEQNTVKRGKHRKVV